MTVETESYSLIEKHLPTLPVPHDCVIEEISLRDGWLVFRFEDKLSRYDSIRHIHPNAQTLTMKLHLTDDEETELLALEHRRYEDVYVVRKRKKLFDLAKKSSALEYLYHKVGYRTLQIEFIADTYYILRLCADRVLMEWHER